MQTAYGAEFRQDVIDAARKGEAQMVQIAKDLGASPAPVESADLRSGTVRCPG